MIPRMIEGRLREKVDYKKAIVIYGPRQVGKTTLVNNLVKDLAVPNLIFNGDDIVTRNLWQKENVAALKDSFRDVKLVVLDEAQMVEDVGSICKQILDAGPGIQLILTGSSVLNIANLTQEPLTGRKREYFLYPLSCGELIDEMGVPEFLRMLPQYLVMGMYPEVVTHITEGEEILANLSSSYLYKDVLAITGIKKPVLLEKILRALAFQLGNEVSLNELSKLVGADTKTLDSYIYLLEQVFVVYRLTAFSGNLRNEIATKKKIYFYDNGIRNALIANYSYLNGRNDIGALWENFLMVERKKWLSYNGFYGKTYFWRNKAQAEIDYIEEIDGKIYAYEFKWNPEVKVRFPKPFLEAYGPQEAVVIHRDNFWQWLSTYPYKKVG